MTLILVPIDEDMGRETTPNTKFGSSPYYLLLDSENHENDTVVKNESKKYGGELLPIKFILNQKPSVVFTTHACENALKHLKEANITPYLVEQIPVSDLLDRYNNGNLEVMVEASH